MKLSIDLEKEWTYDNDSIAQLLRDAINEEIRLAARRLAKEAVKKFESEAKKAVDEAVKRDWRKVAAIIHGLKEEDLTKQK